MSAFRALLTASLVAFVTVLAFAPSAALASEGGPRWTVTSVSTPTNFGPGDQSGDDAYRISVTNTGGASSNGPVTVEDVLPQGLTLDRAGAEGFELPRVGNKAANPGTPLSCGC